MSSNFRFNDVSPIEGLNYYRIKMTDMVGNVNYSKVVSAFITNYELPIMVYPNPGKDKIVVSGNHISSIQLIDNMGRMIRLISLKDASNPAMSVSGWNVGVYRLRIQTSDGKVSSVGFVKE